jgi:hypothetical protein
VIPSGDKKVLAEQQLVANHSESSVIPSGDKKEEVEQQLNVAMRGQVQ